jgi:hypothetical protein
MIQLEYRLVGNVDNTVFTKEFKTREEALNWAKIQGNVFIIQMESTGAVAFNRIYG